MSTRTDTAREARVAQLAADFTQRGYRVIAAPSPALLPCDLNGLQPDLLAENDAEHCVIFVRLSGVRTPIERLQEAAGILHTFPGWKLLLVTGDDVRETHGGPEDLASISHLAALAEQASVLLQAKQAEAALLVQWSVLEGLVRHQAVQLDMPIERFPASALVKHLYSQGELSYDQMELILSALEVQNALTHGYAAGDVSTFAHRLEPLIRQLLTEWFD